MAGSGISVRRAAWAAVALVASTLLTVGASPAQAAPGRAYVPNFGSDTVSVVDTATNTVVTVIPVGDGPESVAVTPDGAFVYVVNNRGGTVSVISTSSNTVVTTVAVGANPRLVTVTPDGKRAWVMGFGGTSVIDTMTNTVVGTVPGLPFSTDVAFSPDGALAYGTRADTLVVVDTATLAVVGGGAPSGHSPIDVEVSPDGARVYVLNTIDSVRVFDTATNTLLVRQHFEWGLRGLAVSPDSTLLYVARTDPTSVLVLDAHTLAVVASVPIDVYPNGGISLSPAGDRLYVTGDIPGVGSQRGRLAVVDTVIRAQVASVPIGGSDVAVTSASPPPPPPPVIEGATFYTDGSSARSGVAPGARVSAFTTSAVPGLDYRLVLSRDGCRTVVAVLNSTPRFASASGVIGSTAGVVPAGTPAGRYQVCFLAPHGTGATVTGPVTLDVV